MMEDHDHLHILLAEPETAQYDVDGVRPMAVIKPESTDPAEVTGVQDKPTRDKIREVHGI